LFIFFGYQLYAQQKPTFPCETLRNSPIYALDFESVGEVGHKNSFISWVNSQYGTQPQVELQYISWESKGIQYQAYFTGINLELIIIDLSEFGIEVKDIISCFGSPSKSSTIARGTLSGVLSFNYLWYDRLRMYAKGIAPTESADGPRLPLNENAEIHSLFIYSPANYEHERD
jgi:hypothetical protein